MTQKGIIYAKTPFFLRFPTAGRRSLLGIVFLWLYWGLNGSTDLRIPVIINAPPRQDETRFYLARTVIPEIFECVGVLWGERGRGAQDAPLPPGNPVYKL